MLVLRMSPLTTGSSIARRSSSWLESGDVGVAEDLRPATSGSWTGEGVVVLEHMVTGVEGGDKDVTSTFCLALRADDVMLARRCWNDPGGGRDNERGFNVRMAAMPPGVDSPMEENAAGE